MGSVKGFLFTIGFLIFCTALITLMIITFSTTFQEDKRISEIASLDRLQSIDSSLQHSFLELFNTFSNINVSVSTIDNDDKTDIMFNETIPNNIADFQTSLDRLKVLTEGNYENIFLNISNLKSTLPIIVKPYNILYTHDFLNNQIQIIPEDVSSTSNLKGYSFVITNLNDASCLNPSFDTTPPDNFFRIKIYGIETTTQAILCEIDTLINPYKKSTIGIGTTNFLTIEIDNGGIATIKNNQGGNPNLASILLLDENTNAFRTKVFFQGSTIRISDPILKVYKKDGVRIL